MSTQSTKKTWGDDVFPFLSWFETQKVREAKVMVVGAGALGNEVIKNLALFGVGYLVIVDFDTIEYGNLTRSVLFRPADADKGLYKAKVAAMRIKEINPDIRVLPICGHLATDAGLGIYRRMDLVIGCLDSLEARIALNRICFRAGKTWIDGGIGDLEGLVSVYQPGKSCYECNLTTDEKAEISKRTSCAGIVQMNEQAGRTATTPVIASLIGAVQVQEAMKFIHPDAIEAGVFTTLAGRLFVYEGAHPSVDIYDFHSGYVAHSTDGTAGNLDFTTHSNDCTAYEYWNPVVEVPALSADTTIVQAIRLIKQALSVDAVEINMRNDKFVDRIVPREEKGIFSPMLPASKIPDYIRNDETLRNRQITEGFYQHEIENIDETFPYPSLTLRQIGIPYFDVMQVSTPKGLFYVELSQDIQKYEAYSFAC